MQCSVGAQVCRRTQTSSPLPLASNRAGFMALMSALVLLLGGCASLSEEECITGDWYGIGQDDGIAGRSIERIAEHRQACGKHRIAIDAREYQDGYDRGLVEFCAPERAFVFGVNGGRTEAICPSDMAIDFTSAYGDGRRLYVMESRLRDLRNELESAARDVQDLERRERRLRRELVDSDSREEREQLARGARRAAQERSRIEYDLRNWAADYRQQERAVSQYRSQLIGFGYPLPE